MKCVNKFNMNFPSKSSNEAFARNAVSAFALQLDPTIEEINNIKTVVSEAVTNSIVHGYADTIGTVYITAEIREKSIMVIKIRDKGCGIEDVEKAMEPLFTTQGGERAGLGFAVMEAFSDGIKVRSKLGVGTTVTLTVKIGRKNGRI